MKKVYCAVCGQEISEDEKAVLIYDQTTDEATLAVCERCCGKARVINDQERKELTKYQDEDDDEYGLSLDEVEEEEVEVSVGKTVAQRIQTTEDLNDYYAYIESEIGNPVYKFPESEQERIEKLMGDLNYAPGYYDRDNVARILGLPESCDMDIDSCLADAIEDNEVVSEAVNNYLSETYGFCTESWQYSIRAGGKIHISNIKWAV